MNGLRFFCGSCALFIGPTSTDFSKFFFKIGSHDTIHIFKNYFTIVFSIFSFHFSAISGIQTDPKIYMKNKYMHIYVVRIFLNAAKLRYPVYTHSMMMWLQQPNWTFFKRKGNNKIVAIWDSVFPIYFPFTLF